MRTPDPHDNTSLVSRSTQSPSIDSPNAPQTVATSNSSASQAIQPSSPSTSHFDAVGLVKNEFKCFDKGIRIIKARCSRNFVKQCIVRID